MKQRRSVSRVNQKEKFPEDRTEEGINCSSTGSVASPRVRATQSTKSNEIDERTLVEPSLCDLENGTSQQTSHSSERERGKHQKIRNWQSRASFALTRFGSDFGFNKVCNMLPTTSSFQKRHRSRHPHYSLWDLSRYATSRILMFLGLWQTVRFFAQRSGEGNDNPYKYQHSFDEHSGATQATHMVMVACHSTLVQNNIQDAAYDENVWHMLDYQRGQGLPQSITSHIVAGIEAAYQDPHSILIFSGGETRNDGTGPWSEGSSYFRAADALNLWTPHNKYWSLGSALHNGEEETSGTNNQNVDGKLLRSVTAKGTSANPTVVDESVRSRTVTEEFATDSFENVMFSICRFKEVTGSYPQKITAVGFTFKEDRFRRLHRTALRWPSRSFDYIGRDAPASTGFNLQRATQGEHDNAVRYFQDDPYGCHSAALQEKRAQRNPFHRTPPYALSCPEMAELLSWCGPELIPLKKVPWASHHRSNIRAAVY